jgi:hypothetical protein
MTINIAIPSMTHHAHRIMTFCIITTTLSIASLNITIHSKMTLKILTLSKMTLMILTL